MPIDLSKVDLSSLSQVAPGEQFDDTEADNLSFNMSEAVKINPDQHAKELDLSRQSGIPVIGVQSDPAAVEQDIKKSQFDFIELRKTNPVTANHFNDIDNAIIAQDDVDVMQSIEDGLKTVREYGEDVAESFGKGQLIVESSEIGLSRMYQALGSNEPVTDEQIARGKEIEDLLKQPTDSRGFFAGAPESAAEQLPIMFEILRTGVGYAAAGGASAAAVGAVTGPGAIPLGITGAKIAGRVGVAKAAFDLEAGLAFNEFSTLKDDKGNFISPQVAGGAAALVGSINAGLEFISLAALGRTVTPLMRNVIKSKVKKALASETGRQMLTRLMKDYGIAVATEAVTESAQEFTNVIGGELAKYIDEDSFTEQDLSSALDNIFSEETGKRVLEAGEKGAQASLIFAGAGTTASVISETRQRERLSESEQLRIDALNEDVGKSEYKKRSKESFKQFVEEADGENNTNVFIDGSQVSLYLQTKTPQEIESDPALKLLAEQAAEASALDSDVQIPVADFAAEIAGTDHFEQLRDSMTMSDETVSPFRQEQVKQETDNYIKTLMEEAQENTSEYVNAQEISDAVRQQLIDTGVYSPKVASTMAEMVPLYFTAKAKREGTTVAEAYQNAGFTVEGPQTGERARLEGEQVLSQEPAFKEAPFIFESARDKFLDVLPEYAEVDEVNDAISEFGPEYKNFIKAIERDDWLGFDFPSQAISAALSEELENFEVSPGLKQAIGRMVNAEAAGKQPFAQQDITDLPESLKPQAGLAEEDFVETDTIPASLQRQTGFELDPKTEGSRADIIAKQKKLLFQRTDSKTARGYYDPANSVIRLTESADLSTFLHEFAHFMYEMEVKGDTEMLKSINNWYKRNADDVAKEANSYLGDKFDVLKQGDRRVPIELKGESDVDKVGTGKPVTFHFIHNTESATGIFGKPKKGDQFGREFEPSGRFVIVSSKKRASEVEGQFIGGELTFNNPLVVPNNGLKWKKTLSKKYNGKTGKSLSLALIADGFDGVITTDENHISEVVDLTTFDEAKALYQPTDQPTAKEGSITADDVVAFLDQTTTGDRDKDAAIRRAVHEQFARGFEAYLMEGKAPSIELRNAFRAFARWLSRIYQPLRGQLNVNLDEQMREVFDRLLATEEQIQAAQARARVEPMFTDAAMAGMTDEEFADYQSRQEKVKDVQSETLRDKIIKQLTRQTETWWKVEKQDIIDEEIQSLSKEKVYRARDRLKSVVSTKTQDEQIVELNKSIGEVDVRLAELEKENDTVGQYIAKVGGLNREAFVAEGVDKDHFKDKMKVFGKPLFPRKGGMTPDELAEKLNEHNYRGGDLSANDALDVVFDMLQDDTDFIDFDANAEVEGLSRELDALEIEKNDVNIQAEQLNIKIDHAAVKAMVGEEKTDKRGVKSVIIPPALRGMTAKGMKGVHPDEAAAFFGYGSGSEMLIDLITAPSIKDQAAVNAEAKMVERHGDILTDGTIEREADEAVRDEERGKLILHELKIIARGTNAPTIDRATIKALAEERVGRLSFREIHPGKYRKAEIRAAQESARMLAEGNREGAAAAKMRQVLNYYLGMAATAAKNDTVKIVDRMSRYNKKKVREAIMKAEGGYWDQIVKILERFEFRKSATLKDVDSINLWAKERLEKHGEELVLSKQVLNESYVTHWKNIPFADLQGINDSVKNIEHVARYANKITLLKESIEFDKLKSKIINHLDKLDTVFRPERTTGKDEAGYTLLEKITGKVKWTERVSNEGVSWMSKVPFMTFWLDKGEPSGLMTSLIHRPTVVARDEELKLWESTALPLITAIKNRPNTDLKRMHQKIYIPEIATVDEDNVPVNTYLYGHQILSVALNAGNAGNLRKMLLGEGWANPDNEAEITINNPKLQAVLDHMTESDWAIVKQVWDSMDSLYPLLSETTLKGTGLIPKKVEPVEFQTKFGKMKGGYYTLQYDHDRDARAADFKDKREARLESMFSTLGSLNQSVTAGATHERTEFYAPIRFDLSVITDHFQEVIHYITHYDTVRQVNKIIRDPVISMKLKRKLGKEEYAKMNVWLSSVAKGGRATEAQVFGSNLARHLRTGMTYVYLGYKLSTILIQPSGLFTARTLMMEGKGYIPQGIMSMLKTIPINGQEGWAARDFALLKSSVLRHRLKTFDREFNDAMKQIEVKEGKIASFRRASMMGIGYIQLYVVDFPVWHAGFEKGMVDFEGDESKAVEYADWLVDQSQGSGDISNMSAMLGTNNQIARLFFSFMTWFNTAFNVQRTLVRGKKQGWVSSSQFAAGIFYMIFATTMYELLIRGEAEPEEDEEPDEYMKRIMSKMASTTIGTVPYARDAANVFVSDYHKFNASPAFNLVGNGLESMYGAASNLYEDEEVTRAQQKGIFTFAATIFHIPGASQAWATSDEIYQYLEEGEEITLKELAFGPDRE